MLNGNELTGLYVVTRPTSTLLRILPFVGVVPMVSLYPSAPSLLVQNKFWLISTPVLPGVGVVNEVQSGGVQVPVLQDALLYLERIRSPG